MKLNEKEIIVNREVRDTLFTHLFRIPEYSKKLYMALHPEDKDIRDDEIETITLETIMINGVRNDIALRIRNVIIILLEDQSSWSPVIIWRMFIYLGETYKRILEISGEDIYGSKPIKLPRPELYVIYTGDKKIDQEYISIKDYFIEDDSDIERKDFIDLKAKIISKKDFENMMTNNKKDDIISEYLEFVSTYEKYLDDYSDSIKEEKNIKAKNKLKREFANKVIDECINKNVLKDYLLKCKSEVIGIMDLLFDQEYATKVHEKAIARDSFNDGKAEGIVSACINFYNAGNISAAVAANTLNISVDEFLKLVEKYRDENN